MYKMSRRKFLKISAAGFAGLGSSPFLSTLGTFSDSQQVRVASKSVSVYRAPKDQSQVIRQWLRDELVNIYEAVDAGDLNYNPIWYRVWGGYMHRGRLQKVKVLYNEPLTSIPEGTRQLAELTVPYTQAMRFTKTYGWQPNLRLCYESVPWIAGIDEGPDGEAWYRIFDELVGFPYHVPALHLRPIPSEEWSPISPELPLEQKRVEVNLRRQVLTAYENEQKVFETSIASGITQLKTTQKPSPPKLPPRSFASCQNTHPSTWATGICLPPQKIMNCLGLRGHVFSRGRLCLPRYILA